LGHAMFVNKDFIEMIALLTLSATTAGRWGGLDYFLHYWVFAPLRSRRRENEI
jgi:hypothetical protein